MRILTACPIQVCKRISGAIAHTWSQQKQTFNSFTNLRTPLINRFEAALNDPNIVIVVNPLEYGATFQHAVVSICVAPARAPQEYFFPAGFLNITASFFRDVFRNDLETEF